MPERRGGGGRKPFNISKFPADRVMETHLEKPGGKKAKFPILPSARKTVADWEVKGKVTGKVRDTNTSVYTIYSMADGTTFLDLRGSILVRIGKAGHRLNPSQRSAFIMNIEKDRK